jgi:peptidyl-prolyl cis-trans isomerase B (cyclophilin B)
VRVRVYIWLALALAATAALLWPVFAEAPGRGPLYVCETEHGSFTLALLRDACPDSAQEFARRVEMGYYDGALIARRPGGRLVQLGTRRLDGPAPACSLKPEAGADGVPAGSLAWALPRGGGPAGYAFFITLADCPELQGYTAFAVVADGLDIVNNLRPGDAILSVRAKHRRRGKA